mgnify:CR=1 FL=1
MSLWGAAGVGTRGRRQSELREEVPLRLLRRTALTRVAARVAEQRALERAVEQLERQGREQIDGEPAAQVGAQRDVVCQMKP